MNRKRIDLTSLSQSELMFIGVVGPLVAQAVITVILAQMAATTPNDDALRLLLLSSFMFTSGAGFWVTVRDCSPVESVLVAVGYFPLMLIASLITGFPILLSLGGATDNF